MNLLVYMRDGRTVYMVRGRGVLSKLVGAEPWHEGENRDAVRGVWNPITGEYVWRPVHLRFIAKGSIGVVEEGTYTDAKDPA